ncbi:MAG TPA: twin-arginine translocase subunit TatC [Microbacteriaceae bacterium]
MSTATRPKRSKNREGRMSLGQHLVELRKRLFRIALGVVVGAVAGWFLYDFVWTAMSAPVTVLAKAHHVQINYTNITSAFDLHMQVAIYTGIVISSPVWLYQIFAFLVPGLTGKEKRYTFGFFFTAIPLFIAGCAAGWFVLPHIINLLTGFAPTGDATLLTASDYFSFVLKLIVATGIAFVLPVFLVLLNFMGILSARGILKAWRIALVVILLFTAIATPSADVISMFMLAIPLVFLYFASAGVAAIHDRRTAKAATRIEDDLAL